MKAIDVLKKYFGYDDFRDSQEEIIDTIMNGRDVLALMPTGSGKSLCYQIPAMLMDGLTVVISPLISLMKDQVDTLNQIGIPSTYINSSLDFDEINNRTNSLFSGYYKLVYIAPERLAMPFFIDTLSQLKVSQLAVDESHCISQWGHDFRPDYRLISEMIKKFRERPVVTAFTATATENCAHDIIKQLDLKNPLIRINSFDRPNIRFEVIETRDKDSELISLIKNGVSTIIYCATRKQVDNLFSYLKEEGFNVGKYHAGMSSEERDESQNKFLNDECDIMIATLAFGMGIDKPDIRKIIHYNMPKSMENYYQEAGRGGRDGLPCDATLLFSPQDIIIQKIIMQNDVNQEENYKKLDKMVDYCRSTNCLRKIILNYFNEFPKEDCSNCSSCNTEFDEMDVLLEAKKIISCIYRMNQGFGINLTVDVLTGSNTKRIKQLGFNSISTYGIMSEYKKDDVFEIINFLLTEEYIGQTSGQYPTLFLNGKSSKLLKSNEPLLMKYKKHIETHTKKVMTTSDSIELTEAGEELFEIIRNWRLNMSKSLSLPPFVIFGNQTINSLIELLPKNHDELLKVKGIGELKAEAYGDELLKLISEYADEEKVYTIKTEKKVIKAPPKGKLRTPTALESYRLYKIGLSPEEIASQRELTTETILRHLYACMQDGLDLDLSRFMDESQREEILNAIEKVGYDRLKPIKEIVSEEISYIQIRMVLLDYEARREVVGCE